MSTDCLICFCPIEGSVYSCGDPLCTSQTCLECTEMLISYSHDNQVIPKCPAEKCNSYYLITGLRGISAEIIQSYHQACLDYMLKDKGEKVQKKMEQNLILERLRKERMKFIQDHYPPAIAYVAALAFNTKIRRLEKQRSRKIADKMNASHRICMNLYCNGHLDENLICLTCSSEFCQKCEKIKKADHRCRQEDIESIEMISQMIHCPECQLPVHKDVGCDSITCSNCNTRFHYSTGERGGHGSSNAKIKVDERRKLSFIYRDQLKDEAILQLLLDIEGHEPTMLTDTAINNSIKFFYETKNSKIAGRQLAKKIDTYFKNKYHHRIYQHILGDVENMLQKNEISIEKMTLLLDQLDHA